MDHRGRGSSSPKSLSRPRAFEGTLDETSRASSRAILLQGSRGLGPECAQRAWTNSRSGLSQNLEQRGRSSNQNPRLCSIVSAKVHSAASTPSDEALQDFKGLP